MPNIGPKYPSTAANDATSGTTAWTNPNNALADDASYATNTSDPTTQYLKLTNFSMGIPTGATIDGIIAEIKLDQAPAGGFLQIVKGGVRTGSAKSLGGANPQAYTSFGSASDLWGATLSESDVNNSGFGVAFQANNGGKGNQPVQVDTIRLTVYYTGGGGGGSNASAILFFL